MLTPPKRQSRAIMADSLFPKDRKKQETQDITLEPAGTRRESNETQPWPSSPPASLATTLGHCFPRFLNPCVCYYQ